MQITINGRQVTVDDSFRSLSPEEQDATIDEIADTMSREEAATSIREGAETTKRQIQSAGYNFGNVLTLGAGPHLRAGAESVGREIGSLFTGEEHDFTDDYGQTLEAIRGRGAELSEEHPWAALTGGLLGALPTGRALGVLGTRLAGATGGTGIGARLAGQGAVGAAAGGTMAGLEGNDITTGALIGGAAGAGGEAASTYLGALKNAVLPSAETVKRQLADLVFETIPKSTGKPSLTPEAIVSAAKEAPDTLLTDLDDAYLTTFKNALGSGAQRQTLGKAKQMADALPGEVQFDTVMTDMIRGPTRAAMRSSGIASMDVAKEAYTSAIGGMSGSTPAGSVRRAVVQAFGEHITGPTRTARDKLLQEVDTIAGDTGVIDHKSLHNFMKDVGNQITDIDRFDASATVKATRNGFTNLKRRIDDGLRKMYPEYADASSLYADEFAVKKAIEFGGDTAKRAAATESVELRQMYDGLSLLEKDAFNNGFMAELRRQYGDLGPEKLAQKLAGERGGRGLNNVLSELYPEVADMAPSITAQAARTNKVKSAVESGYSRAVGEMTSPTAAASTPRSIGDIFTLAATPFAGVHSGAVLGSAKRLQAGTTVHQQEAVNDAFADLASKQGPELAAALDELYGFLGKPKKPSVSAAPFGFPLYYQ